MLGFIDTSDDDVQDGLRCLSFAVIVLAAWIVLAPPDVSDVTKI